MFENCRCEKNHIMRISHQKYKIDENGGGAPQKLTQSEKDAHVAHEENKLGFSR